MGSGKNAAIVHYRATKDNTKIIEDNDILLCENILVDNIDMVTDVKEQFVLTNQIKVLKIFSLMS